MKRRYNHDSNWRVDVNFWKKNERAPSSACFILGKYGGLALAEEEECVVGHVVYICPTLGTVATAAPTIRPHVDVARLVALLEKKRVQILSWSQII